MYVLNQENPFDATPERIALFLAENYNLKGSISPLPGEIDLNYKVETREGDLYVLKLYSVETELDFLDFQEQILTHLKQKEKSLLVPEILLNKTEKITSIFVDQHSNTRKARLLSWISGRVYNHVNPHTSELRYDLGNFCGRLSNSLKEFDHSYAHRQYPWDIAQGLWSKAHLDLFDQEEQHVLIHYITQFEKIQKRYTSLRKGVVHNDANDFNIIVSNNTKDPKVVALIDFGDAVHTQIINDVAIACCYAIMDFEDPLEAAIHIVKGYHQTYPLLEEELEVLYLCIAVRLLISVTKSRINKIKEPNNPYLQISEKPAWKLLNKWIQISSDFAQYTFREACGLPPHPKSALFYQWAKERSFTLDSLFPTLSKTDVFPIDLSVSSSLLGPPSEFNNLDWFEYQLREFQKEHPKKIIAGGYLEPRPLYTDVSYDKMGNNGLESRCMHLGIDFWIPKNTPVHALFDGEVILAENDSGNKKYGGLIVLRHREGDLVFFTLYGHLSLEKVEEYTSGDRIPKGGLLGFIGDSNDNGNWVPHLHFQVILNLLGHTCDFPGVGFYNQKRVWESLCPNPNLLFKIKELESIQIQEKATILQARKNHLGKGMSLQYKDPLHIVRGSGVYLIDQHGRKYLDTVNNVAHVGHEHPEVVKAGQRQMGVLNTNSRYIHSNITNLAAEIKKTLPPELSVLHFVNSGSEANELALRMVKAATGSKEMVVSEVGYHGNTNGCIDISSYKFDGKGGQGAPEYTHVFPMPDAFRGKYRGENTANAYADEVQFLLDKLKTNGKKLGGFIIEPILSCGGQIEIPEGFLKKVYPLIRSWGGLCISDEVQTGCGRMGKTFWGFQLHDVVPDIVTIGKPLGNGHPIAAVACTEEVATKFANGMEFFNTFGGNPVSCAIASKVLQIVQEEKLQQNALEVGNFLKTGLKELAKKYPIIASVRGQGLFLGIELTDEERNPLSEQTAYLANRMKENGILMSTDGPDHNVLKIKPPLIFKYSNAQLFLQNMDTIFAEDQMHIIKN